MAGSTADKATTDENPAKRSSAPAVLIQSVNKWYGHFHVLKNIDLTVASGEKIVICGPSGSGKSTLIRCINRLEEHQSGHIIVDGVELTNDVRNIEAIRSETGMVFQQHHLIGRLTVLANVLTGRLGYHGSLATLLPWSREEKERALAAIDRVGLLDRALQRADQLSGGQQQRVGVARALVQEPRILLADEPVASLDPATAERLLMLLRDICKSDGLTAVVSLHQLAFARRFADRIIGLAGGAVIFDGAPRQLSDEIAARLYGAPATPRHKLPAADPIPDLQPERAFI